jgi:MFS family permease
MLAKIKQSPWMTLAILSSIGLITMYAETMLLPAIPDIIRDFHINYSTSSWILTAYLISGAVMTPIAGKLSDIYGKKKVLLIIMIISTLQDWINKYAKKNQIIDPLIFLDAFHEFKLVVEQECRTRISERKD